jgi:hypothetical protein
MKKTMSLDSLFKNDSEKVEIKLETSNLKIIVNEFIIRNDLNTDMGIDELKEKFLYFLSSKTAHKSTIYELNIAINYIRLILEEKGNAEK